MTDVQRRTRPLRVCRALFTAVLLFDLPMSALDFASGKHVTAAVMAFAAMLVAAAVVLQTIVIRRMKRTQELTHRAEQLELAAEAARQHPEWKPAIAAEWQQVKSGMGTMAGFEAGMARLSATVGPCSHPDAEPVDLSTGERVAWVCPDCDAELPAGWTPQAKGMGGGDGGEYATVARRVALSPLEAEAERERYREACDCPDETRDTVQVRVPESATPVASYCAACGRGTGTLTCAGPVQISGAAALSGSGTLSAKATWDDVAYASEVSQHFAQLAKVGLESCISRCPICEDRQWIEEGRFS